jgi:hypothetical protein
MNQQRQCPMCGRTHEVADDGTIATWDVRWTGDEAPQFGPGAYLSPERTARLEQLRVKHPERGQRQQEQSVADIPGYISNREENFIHYEDAQRQYAWIKGILQQRGDWVRMQKFLTLTEGERAKWSDLFEEPGIHRWMA